jgi:hypothetical protein
MYGRRRVQGAYSQRSAPYAQSDLVYNAPRKLIADLQVGVSAHSLHCAQGCNVIWLARQMNEMGRPLDNGCRDKHRVTGERSCLTGLVTGK